MKHKIDREYLVPTVIRIALTVALGFGVYAETGFWTVVWYGLMMVYVEVQVINKRIELAAQLRSHQQLIDKLTGRQD